jgi:hypothetical protein
MEEFLFKEIHEQGDIGWGYVGTHCLLDLEVIFGVKGEVVMVKNEVG